MKGDESAGRSAMRPRASRALLAAGLWFLLAFLAWNVRFDYGVRLSATHYLVARAYYLRHHGPEVYLSDAMRDGIAHAARSATHVATPIAMIATALLVAGICRVSYD